MYNIGSAGFFIIIIYLLLLLPSIPEHVFDVDYWEAHDCSETVVKKAMACNLLCKPVWTAPSSPSLLSYSEFNTHTGDLSGVECQWRNQGFVKRAIPTEMAESWSRVQRRPRLSSSCTTPFAASCERDHMTGIYRSELNTLSNRAESIYCISGYTMHFIHITPAATTSFLLYLRQSAKHIFQLMDFLKFLVIHTYTDEQWKVCCVDGWMKYFF